MFFLLLRERGRVVHGTVYKKSPIEHKGGGTNLSDLYLSPWNPSLLHPEHSTGWKFDSEPDILNSEHTF